MFQSTFKTIRDYLYCMIPDESRNIIFSEKTVTGQLGGTYDLFNYDRTT